MFAASTTVGRVFRYRNSGMPKNSLEVTKSVAAQCLFVHQGSEVIHRLLLHKAKRTFVRRKRKGSRKIIAVSGVNLFAYFYFLWRTDLFFQQGVVSLDIPALGWDTQLGVERKKKIQRHAMLFVVGQLCLSSPPSLSSPGTTPSLTRGLGVMLLFFKLLFTDAYLSITILWGRVS